MKFKSFLVAVLLTAITLSSCGDGNKRTSKAETLSPENQSIIDSISYVFGNQIGAFMQGYGGNFNIDLFRKGIDDVANDMADSLKMVPMERDVHDRLFGAFNEMQLEIMQKTNLQEADDFLAENGKKKGVITTASGLQYEVLAEGEGATPAIDESVTVHYHGTFSNGETFDSSVERNEPATFPISGVIPGWTEALQLMKKGSKYRLVLPPNLAYGENGKRNPMSGEFGIEPNELLIFEVELLEIIPATEQEEVSITADK